MNASRRAFSAGLILVIAVSLALFVSLTRSVPLVDFGEDGYRIRAEFTSTNELRGGDPVRVRGIQVGAVEDIDLTRGGRGAVVTMRITDPKIRVRRDARLHMRWRTLLGGNPYIDLEPGSPSMASVEDEVLPPGQTTAQVEFDEMLDVYDGSTPRAIRNNLRQLSTALDDERAVGRLIDSLPQSFSTVGRGAEPFRGERRDDLGELVQAMSRTVRALDRGGRRLDSFVTGGGQTFGTLAGNRSAVGAGLRTAPPALASTETTMHRLRPTLDRLDLLAADLMPPAGRLQPALSRLRPTLEETRGLLEDARPLLRSLPNGFDELRGASRQGAPLMSALRPTIERLDGTLIPFLERRDEETGLRNYEAIGPTGAAAGSAGSEFDGGGYMLHFPSQSDERSVLSSPCQPFITDPSASEKVRCDALADILGEALNPGAARP